MVTAQSGDNVQHHSSPSSKATDKPSVPPHEEDQGLHSFGFSKVSAAQKTTLVNEVFSSVAGRYDLMNDLMSGGLHRLWKDALVQMIRPRPALQHIDMAGGTGDIAFRSYKACQTFANADPNIVVCDQNADMLLEGKKRAFNQGITKGISWAQGDAANPPFETDSFDVYTISFGLRNVTHREQALAEAFRILKPGGQFFCMEFSPLKESSVFAKLYKEYAFRVIPKIGSLIAGDQDSYKYLVESIEAFPTKEALLQEIQTAGFSQVTYRSLNNGLVAIHSGVKS